MTLSTEFPIGPREMSKFFFKFSFIVTLILSISGIASSAKAAGATTGSVNAYAAGRAPVIGKSKLSLVQLVSTSKTANAYETQLLCSLSSFFSVDPDEVVSNHITFEGRGLLNCRSEQGFSTEIPVRLSINADAESGFAKNKEIAFSLNSDTFVVPRETSQLEDVYEVQSASRLPASTSTPTEIFLRGQKRDIVISGKITGSRLSNPLMKITSLSVSFDDSAPDLRASL